MFSHVAKLFMFCKWFAIILETSRQLAGLESLLVFVPFLPLGKSNHHKIASILTVAWLVYLALQCTAYGCGLHPCGSNFLKILLKNFFVEN